MGGRPRYTADMQLRTARLCLDCEEVHDEYRCPACASDAFSYISRWVPIPDRRGRPRPAPTRPPEYDAYREIARGPATPARRGRPWLRALAGVGAAAGVAGLFWGARQARGPKPPDDEQT